MNRATAANAISAELVGNADLQNILGMPTTWLAAYPCAILACNELN